MALYAPVNNSEFTPAPAGQKSAICVDVIDLGIQNYGFGPQHKIRLQWQLAELNPESGEPYLIWKNYTFSMSSRSNLFKDLIGWRSKTFTAEEAAAFDIESLIGVHCLLNILHSTRGDKTYADVVSISRLPDGYPVAQNLNYVRHINRRADESPKDVRNPAYMHAQQPAQQQPTNGVQSGAATATKTVPGEFPAVTPVATLAPEFQTTDGLPF